MGVSRGGREVGINDGRGEGEAEYMEREKDECVDERERERMESSSHNSLGCGGCSLLASLFSRINDRYCLADLRIPAGQARPG